jgi:hypothetical protein
MSQCPLTDMGFGPPRSASAAASSSAPPAPPQEGIFSPRSGTPGPQQNTQQTILPTGSPAPRKCPNTTFAQNTYRPMMFGQPNNDIMHQILARFDHMETAFAASQNTSANRITQLEKQVAQLTAEIRKLCPQPTNPHANKPTKANPERGRSAAPPAPTLAIPLHAPVPNEWNALWNGSHDQTLADHLNGITERTQDEKPFTTVERKKKKTPTTVIPKALPRADREVIITLGEKVTDHATIADQALQAINKVIKESTDITQPPFILARITSNNRLVLATNPTTKASDYTPYLQIIVNVTQQLKPTETRINERWTKFLLHNVPTNANLPAVRSEIEDTYPSLRLGQNPRWLVPTERRTNKAASTLVISLIGNVNYKRLGTSQLAICNRMCKIDEYFSWHPTSQCSNCQEYGHHPKLCKADHPRCAVCAQNHTTKNHPCTISTCHAGGTCTHPPVQCANCKGTHKAYDQTCPVRIKHMEEHKNKSTPDESMEPEDL